MTRRAGAARVALSFSLGCVAAVLALTPSAQAEPAAQQAEIAITGQAPRLQPVDVFSPTDYVYLPLVLKPFYCPVTSSNVYAGGTAYQFDNDDPVRPAWNHADKNIELRFYSANTDPSLQRELVDYASHELVQPPQFATMFNPYRVPTMTTFYRVHAWFWASSPDPGTRGPPIDSPDTSALGLQPVAGEELHVPASGYTIGGGMEVVVLFADEDTVTLRYSRDDSAGSAGYTVHVDNICADPNLLALYDSLDNPTGPRYTYVPPGERPYSYDLPNLAEGEVFGTARSEELVVAIVDTGAFIDTRSCTDWWQIRPGYAGSCPPVSLRGARGLEPGVGLQD
jgi:hypothetical protein